MDLWFVLIAFNVILILWHCLRRSHRNVSATDGEEEAFYKLATLLPYVVKENDVYHHTSIVTLGRAVDPSLVLPKYFKYKESLLVPICSQGKCASCWAYAVADCIGDRVSIKTRGAIRNNLSVQELLSCFRPAAYPCNRGGIPELAYQYVIVAGLFTEAARPYKQYQGGDIVRDCITGRPGIFDYLMPDPNRAVKHPEKIFAQSDSVRHLCSPIPLKGYSKEKLEDNIRNMKTEIFVNGPIVGTLMVYDDLYRYDGESVYVVSKNAKFRGGHAIEIFGWSDAGQNTEEKGFEGAYWICRKSWGTRWPREVPKDNAGWFYVRMGTNESGIESRASSAIPLFTEEMKAYARDRTNTPSHYMSYTEYVEDPERKNFFSHLQRRRDQRTNKTSKA